MAFSMSFSASASAFLQSIMPAPVRSRRALTSLADISVVLTMLGPPLRVSSLRLVSSLRSPLGASPLLPSLPASAQRHQPAHSRPASQRPASTQLATRARQAPLSGARQGPPSSAQQQAPQFSVLAEPRSSVLAEPR